MGRVLEEIGQRDLEKELTEGNKSSLNYSGAENKRGPELIIQGVSDVENKFLKRSFSQNQQNIINNRQTANFNVALSQREVANYEDNEG